MPEHDEQTPPVPTVDDGLKTPTQWAALLLPEPREQWKHAAAEASHGWKDHAHHAGEELRLSEDAYRRSVDAAISGKGPIEEGLGEFSNREAYKPPPEPEPAKGSKVVVVKKGEASE